MSGQKFIARNRAPRVQIEYDVELYGAEKKVQLPFVMGVMSDLSGKAEKPSVGQRDFLEIDVDNFDDRMRAIAPKAQFSVPNTLTGEGNLEVDLTFQKMSDFSPEAIAENVGALKPLLEARRQLSNLMTYMDGKSGAEALLENLLSQPALLQALAASDGQGSADMDAALEGLKAAMPTVTEDTDTTDGTLAALAAAAPEDTAPDTTMDDVLGAIDAPVAAEDTDTTNQTLDGLRSVEVPETAEEDGSQDVLNTLASSAPEDTPDVDTTDDVLANIQDVEDVAEGPSSDDVLNSIDTSAPEAEEEDNTAEILGSIEAAPEAVEEDTLGDALASIDTSAPEAEEEDNTAEILGSIEAAPEAVEEDTLGDALASIDTSAPDVEEEDNTAEILGSIEAAPEVEEADDTAEILGSIEAAPEVVAEDDGLDDVLAGLDAVEEAPEADDLNEALASIDTTAPEPASDGDDLDDILADLDAPEETGPADPVADDVLAGLEDVQDVEAEDDLDDILSALDTPDVQDDETTAIEDVLGGIETAQEEQTEDTSLDDLLADIEAPDEEPEEATSDAVLAGIETVGEPETDAEDTSLDDLLADIEAPDEEPEEATSDAVLAGIETVGEPETDAEDTSLDDLLADIEAPVEQVQADTSDAVLAGIELAEEPVDAADDLDAVLADLEPTPEPDADADDLDALLADLGTDEEPEDSETDDLDALLADLGSESEAVEDPAQEDDLDALLADLGADSETVETSDDDDAPDDDLDALLADIDTTPDETDDSGADDLDALLADLNTDDAPNSHDVSEPDDDLDALLADLETDEEPDAPAAAEDDLDALLADLGSDDAGNDDSPESGDDDLDALLADLDAEPETETAPEGDSEDDLDALLASLDDDTDSAADNDEDDLDALLAGLDSDDDPMPASGAQDDDLDALLADLDGDADDDSQSGSDMDEETTMRAEPKQSPYGLVSAPRPDRDALGRKKFRMAVFGDFTGRAARGLMETGDALAARRPIELDVDTIDDIIEGFATTVTLPIGKDGAGIEIKLKEMDDLHPDELYEKVEIFEAISSLRQQLSVGSMAGKVTEQLQSWSEEFGTPVKIPKRSASTAIPANVKLSDFQTLIGDTGGTLTQASPADDLIAQVVGPHIVKAPDAGAEAMKNAVDEALSGAMRMVLHHPDFQAVESQWRSLDMLARRVETDSTLQIVLYDVSAEELAVDLAANEDLAQSGLFKLLTDVLDPEEGAGGFSALFGMYTFEETPTHAELLARISQVCAHVDAPFFAGITPGYLDVAKEDRHPLVAEAWETLRAMPEAAYVGLASPRFLLRQPYGAKSEPIYEFEFEEFTPQEGLSGMLWANPAVLVAILLAGTYKKDGKAMDLGSLMSLGDMPFHYVNDRYGDQVALPCTERNLTSDPAQMTLARGFMPVVWVKGRNEIRLGSFRALGGEEIAGPWSGATPPPRKEPPKPNLEIEAPAGDDEDDDDTSLDDLLAGFGDDDDDLDDADSDDMDPELAALLEGL